jgi:hypothetical protein
MFIFFHDIGMPPLWILILWLLCFLAFPLFFIKGLYSLIRQKSARTIALSFIVLFFLALLYPVFALFILSPAIGFIDFFMFLSFPFGVGAMPLFAVLGLYGFPLELFGIVINLISIYGAVGTIENWRLKK